MHSRYAEQPETNNITGIRNPRVDAICERYDKSYDVDERIRLLRELDGIVTREYHYAFGWVAPYAARLVFWNKFGIPEKGLSYSGDWRSLFALWWVDPEKRAALEHARMHPGVRLPRGKTVIDPWGKRPGLAAQNAPAR
jgi:microcin C transport system substrate-binding protein